MTLIRVFLSKTNATPNDKNARYGLPELFDYEKDISVDVSVTFKWDLPQAEHLFKNWEIVTNKISIGGPATGDAGGDFVPGKYLKKGYVITSRGCPNRCWFCDVWKREGIIRELPVCEGNNVLDSNLLACSDQHIEKVFEMLEKQKNVQFTGGLEAKRLNDRWIDRLAKIKPKQIFCAYDKTNDLTFLVTAGRNLLKAGFTKASHALRCYVLCGYPDDTIEEAESRMYAVMKCGFMPMAMYYRENDWELRTKDWHDFTYFWTSPIAMAKKYRETILYWC